MAEDMPSLASDLDRGYLTDTLAMVLWMREEVGDFQTYYRAAGRGRG
jgi:hypothetical protein